MLYVVGTPIGHLADISLRAIDVLHKVSVIACEDTRLTRKLMSRHGISTPLTLLHEHNERTAAPKLIERLKAGADIALVSDAGMPLVQDPGYRLVQAAIAENVDMTVVPGPTAFVAALILAGLPIHAFTFKGFPPRKSGARKKFLAVDLDSPHTLVFYESPHRLLAFLQDAAEVLGDRPAAVVKEITKIHETSYRGSLTSIQAQLSQQARLQGEFCVVISGATATGAQGSPHSRSFPPSAGGTAVDGVE